MSALLALYSSSVSQLSKLLNNRTPDTEESVQKQVRWLGEISRTLLSVYQIESAKQKASANPIDPINSPPQAIPTNNPPPSGGGIYGRPPKPGEWRPT